MKETTMINIHQLKREIGELVGGATVCWEHIEKAGVFDSTKASAILDEIYAKIDELVEALY
jgi:hypothetical protein